MIKALHVSLARQESGILHVSPSDLEDVLARYLAWAPTVDRFTAIRVSSDYEVDILTRTTLRAA